MPTLTKTQERILAAIRADGFDVAQVQVSPRGVMTLTVYGGAKLMNGGPRHPEYMMVWRFDRYGEIV